MGSCVVDFQFALDVPTSTAERERCVFAFNRSGTNMEPMGTWNSTAFNSSIRTHWVSPQSLKNKCCMSNLWHFLDILWSISNLHGERLSLKTHQPVHAIDSSANTLGCALSKAGESHKRPKFGSTSVFQPSRHSATG